MLASLTDAIRDSSSCKSFALGVSFHTSIDSCKRKRYLSQWKFKTSPMSILCLRERNNMEPNNLSGNLLI